MIDRTLTNDEINELLKKQCYAHLGFTGLDGNIHVLPISYVYDDGVFFSFSTRGEKIEAMRAHKNVCIQVEDLHPTTSWKSVQAWGTFSEVGSSDIHQFEKLVSDFWKRFDKDNLIFSVFRDFMDNPKTPMTLYHITVNKMVGKQGSHSREPLF